jgi:hypothetical protein
MSLAKFTARPAALLSALEALSQRSDYQNEAELLLEELSGITVLVAQKYTNDRTAEGIQEALCLTIGCVSLGLVQAELESKHAQSPIDYLRQHGAESAFQMGFRQIKALSALPYVAFISEFERDPFIQQRNIKLLFNEICYAEPSESWLGCEIYQRELKHRQENQLMVECAQWLRRHHFGKPISEIDIDAHAVISIAIIFALYGDGRIVARVEQTDIEALIRRARANQPDIETAWQALIVNVPPRFHSLLQERMRIYQTTILKKILSKSKISGVIREIQDCYAGNEQDVIYD